MAAGKLGEIHNVNSDSQDVTEEYYDVDARIRNKKQEETRLNDLLAKAAGRLDEVLTLEREITRVRGEVEQLQGRLHVLDSVTAMSTVNLEISEIKEFVPGEPVSYGMRSPPGMGGLPRRLALHRAIPVDRAGGPVALDRRPTALFAGGDSRATGALGTQAIVTYGYLAGFGIR